MFGHVGRAIRGQVSAVGNCDGLFFSERLSPPSVRSACEQLQHEFRDRIFSPAITLWVFLSQVLSADHSCREAVAKLNFWRLTRGLRPCSPDTVRKEFYTHLLAYNLIRGIIMEAAAAAGVAPHQLSFKGALQSLSAFLGIMVADATNATRHYAALLWMIAAHRVAHRPDRIEPRLLKRRPKPHKLLQEPRANARNRLLKTN